MPRSEAEESSEILRINQQIRDRVEKADPLILGWPAASPTRKSNRQQKIRSKSKRSSPRSSAVKSSSSCDSSADVFREARVAASRGGASRPPSFSGGAANPSRAVSD
jgi:hypothetical protein